MKIKTCFLILLKPSKAYILREKLNNGCKLSIDEKIWINEQVRNNSRFSKAIPVMGWKFDFSDVLKTYVVKQYGQWCEYYAMDKTSLRKSIYGKVEKIVEV